MAVNRVSDYYNIVQIKFAFVKENVGATVKHMRVNIHVCGPVSGSSRKAMHNVREQLSVQLTVFCRCALYVT